MMHRVSNNITVLWKDLKSGTSSTLCLPCARHAPAGRPLRQLGGGGIEMSGGSTLGRPDHHTTGDLLSYDRCLGGRQNARTAHLGRQCAREPERRAASGHQQRAVVSRLRASAFPRCGRCRRRAAAIAAARLLHCVQPILTQPALQHCRADWALAGAFAVVFGVQRLVPTFEKEWCGLHGGAHYGSAPVRDVLLLSTAR